ncbi:PAS domain S-box protein [Patescibacteria group bacterium]|nr:PAS domain S-box protein [Patescibacteria group bacterium]
MYNYQISQNVKITSFIIIIKNMSTLFLKEQRCECGKLLLKGIFFHATLEIKCKKCGQINKIGSIKELESDKAFLLVFNNRGFITNASEAACCILEYSHDELIGKHFSEIDTDTDPEIFQKLMPPNSILTEEHYLQLDAINKTKSGKKFPVNVILKLYKPDDGEAHVLVSVNMKDDDSNLKDSEDDAKFKKYACDFYFDLDTKGFGTFISAEVEKLFGISPALGLGKNYFDFVPANKRDEAQALFNHFVAKEQAYKALGNTSIDVGGKKVDSDLFFTPNFNSEGKFIGYRVSGWLKTI